MDEVKEAKIPVGFIVMIIYLIISILSTFSGIFSKSSLLFGYAISGSIAVIYNLIIILIAILIIYSIIKRLYWGWILAIVYFIFSIFGGIVSLLLLIFNRQTMINNLIIYIGFLDEEVGSNIALITGWTISIFAIIISATLLIYFYRKKDFFTV